MTPAGRKPGDYQTPNGPGSRETNAQTTVARESTPCNHFTILRGRRPAGPSSVEPDVRIRRGENCSVRVRVIGYRCINDVAPARSVRSVSAAAEILVHLKKIFEAAGISLGVVTVDGEGKFPAHSFRGTEVIANGRMLSIRTCAICLVLRMSLPEDLHARLSIGPLRMCELNRYVRHWPQGFQMILPTGLRVFVIGLNVWYHLQTQWFSGNFRLQAVGVVLLLYWVLGCLVVFTRGRPTCARPRRVAGRENGAGNGARENGVATCCNRSVGWIKSTSEPPNELPAGSAWP
jgi:hypothetical protein